MIYMSGKFQDYLMKHKSSLEGLIPHIYGFLTENMLEAQIQDLFPKKAKIKIDDSEVDEFFEIVKNHHEKEFERKGVIEDKAKSSLFIVTLSVTLILGSLNFINVDKIMFPKFLLVFLIIGVIYIIFSGITAIKALHMKPYNDIVINSLIIGEDYDNLTAVKMPKKTELSETYECIRLNQLLTIIKSNYVEVTFLGIRNGLILVATFFILDAINIIFPNCIVNILVWILPFILMSFVLINFLMILPFISIFFVLI